MPWTLVGANDLDFGLLAYIGPKDEVINNTIKALPGVAWDQTGRRWIIPAWYHHILHDLGVRYDPSITVFAANARIWARKAPPLPELFDHTFIVTEGEKFCNPQSQRTQNLVKELEARKGPLLIVTSLDMYSNLEKAFALLELAYPGRFGRWPERFSGRWRFMDRYADWEEGRFGRVWKGLNPEFREEYLSRLRGCAYIDEPPVDVADEDVVEAKGLFE